MINAPCKNPNCASCGKPHPHCRCYSEGGDVAPKYEETEPINAKSDIPSYEETEPISNVPSYEDTEPVTDNSDSADTLDTLKATGEGALRGITGPLSVPIEKMFGAKEEDIAGRERAHPIAHGIGEAAGIGASLLTDVGLPAVIAKATSAIPEISALGKMGTSIIRGMIDTASFQASDEITKAILGQKDADSTAPVSAALLHIGAAGIMGGATSGVFNLGEKLIGKGIEGLGSGKTGQKIADWLTKIGESGDPLGKTGASKALQQMSDLAAESLSGTGAAAIKKMSGGTIPWGIPYHIIHSKLSPIFENITGKAITKSNKYVTDAILKSIAAGELRGIPNATHFATQAGRGMQKATDGIERFFQAGESQIAPDASDFSKKQLKDFIDKGQVESQMQNQMQMNTTKSQPQGFAHGGEVKPMQSSPSDRFSTIFPEQNTSINEAKGRISNYLNSIRPLPDASKLAFDEKPSDTEKKRNYDKAINLAVNPMAILDKVNKGDLTPEDMGHFTSLYPEVHRFLSQQMTKRILKAQLNDEKPPYAKRQAMSLFLGSPLDGSLTPQAIQSAQSVFTPKPMPQQPPTKNKKGTSSLSKVSQGYQTDSQSREMRDQRQKV